MGLGIEVLPKFLITPIYLLLLFKKINSMLFFRLQPNIYIYIYIFSKVTVKFVYKSNPH
jgi:hypothetical protein